MSHEVFYHCSNLEISNEKWTIPNDFIATIVKRIISFWLHGCGTWTGMEMCTMYTRSFHIFSSSSRLLYLAFLFWMKTDSCALFDFQQSQDRRNIRFRPQTQASELLRAQDVKIFCCALILYSLLIFCHMKYCQELAMQFSHCNNGTLGLPYLTNLP